MNADGTKKTWGKCELSHFYAYRAGHAADELRYAQDLASFYAVAVIGGDGLLFEAVQGIAARPDADEVFRTLALGAVCGGSGNGLCKSVLAESGEDYSALAAAFVLAKGAPRALDLSHVTTPRGGSYLSFLSLSWAIVSDIDIESERFRCLGSARFAVGAVSRSVNLRVYSGRLSFLPAPAPGAGGEEAHPPQAAALPGFGEPPPASWTMVEDDFIMTWVVQAPHQASDMYVSPGSALSDGLFHIFVLRRATCSRAQLLAMFLAIEDGSHLSNPALEVHVATAYRLEPLVPQGVFSLDGEVVEYGPIQGRVLPSKARVLSIT